MTLILSCLFLKYHFLSATKYIKTRHFLKVRVCCLFGGPDVSKNKILFFSGGFALIIKLD